MSLAAKAYATIQGYDELTAAIHRIDDEHKRHLSQKLRPSVVTAEQFVQSALNDDPFPTDVTGAKEAHERDARNHKVRRSLIESARTTLQDRRTAAVKEHSDEALKFLDSKLGSLVEKVRHCANNLKGSPNLAEVYARRDPEEMAAWDTLTNLVDAYKEIRDAQVSITGVCLGGGDRHMVFEAGFLRNSLDHSAYWQEKRRASYSVRAADDQDENVRNYNKWLTDYPVARYPFTPRTVIPVSAEEETAFLIYTCSHLDLWVPTVSQLTTAWESANGASQVMDYTRLVGMEDARDQFYKVTGSSPAAYTRSTGPAKKRVKHKPDLAQAYANEFLL